MRSFTTHHGLVVPLDKSNVDTDQIIPKQYLKAVTTTGYAATSNRNLEGCQGRGGRTHLVSPAMAAAAAIAGHFVDVRDWPELS